MPSGFWQIWIDTGGTFTDCLAISPTGVRHHAKVLSNSALRAVATPAGDARTWRVEAPWQVPPGFFGAARARILGSTDAAKSAGVSTTGAASAGGLVTDFEPSTRTLSLSEPLSLDGSATASAPVVIEIRTPRSRPFSPRDS